MRPAPDSNRVDQLNRKIQYRKFDIAAKILGVDYVWKLAGELLDRESSNKGSWRFSYRRSIPSGYSWGPRASLHRRAGISPGLQTRISCDNFQNVHWQLPADRGGI